MQALFWQTCSIYRRNTPAFDGREPVTTETTILSDIPCRLDDAISSISQSTERITPASYAEELNGIVYTLYHPEIQPTDIVRIIGDDRVFEIAYVHKQPSYSGIHHLELAVRTFTHK